jgi:plastocyanin
MGTQHDHANARNAPRIRLRATWIGVKYAKLFPFASLLVAAASVYACSSSTTAAPAAPTGEAGTDAATGDATPAAPDAGGADTSTPLAIRCTQAEFDQKAGTGGGDFTGFGGADISFPTTGAPAQYVNHCVKVKVGANVTWAGSFSSHPLMPAGGDTPTPIPSQSTDPDGGAVSVIMTTAGTFGFECGFHPSIMFGAVQVVP